jgi:tetratricopeptide (TPR) repeat protein
MPWRVSTGVMAAVVAALMLSPPVDAGMRAGFAQTATEWLTRYGSGDQSAVIAEIGRTTDFAPIAAALARAAPRWAASGQSPDRRLVAAALLLEVARAGMETSWADVRGLVEAGCSLLRQDEIPSPSEHVWQRAALALIEGASDAKFLRPSPLSATGTYDHLRHLTSRFPSDDRVALAAVVSPRPGRADAEFPRDVVWQPVEALEAAGPAGRVDLIIRRDKRAMIAELEPLTTRPDVAAEANLRLGYLLFQLHEDTDAMTRFDRTIGSTDDPFLLYVAELLAGRTEARRGRASQAERRFRRALAIVPHAESASEALAAELFVTGRADEASALADAALPGPDSTPDPWRLFGYGDFRLLPALMDDVRRAVRP